MNLRLPSPPKQSAEAFVSLWHAGKSSRKIILSVAHGSEDSEVSRVLLEVSSGMQ